MILHIDDKEIILCQKQSIFHILTNKQSSSTESTFVKYIVSFSVKYLDDYKYESIQTENNQKEFKRVIDATQC